MGAIHKKTSLPAFLMLAGTWLRHLTTAALVSSTAISSAESIRVDLGPALRRSDTRTPHWHEWQVEEGRSVSRTFEGITVTLRQAGPVGRGIGGFWYKGGLDDGATMATDGVRIAEGDEGGQLELVLSGLAPGRHTLATYHNSIWNRRLSTYAFSVDGRPLDESITPSVKVRHNDDVRSMWMRFDVREGREVVVRIAPDGSGEVDNVLLNGFEIDGVDPGRKARKPSPSNDDEHVDGGAGVVALSWSPAAGAVSHRVYIASNHDRAAAVAAVSTATADSPQSAGAVARARFDVDIVDRNSLLHFSWRVDTIDAKGDVTRGDTWRFRVRHRAFPGAEGYGRYAIGGRGGRVMEVTNLKDAGPGSLREAIEADGPRTVVFNVGGLISLQSKLVFRNPYLTVAGQTAPGKGICIRNWTFGGLGARDTVIRFTRLRLGDLAKKTMDGMGLASSDHSIIDHCSISWTIDEAFSSRGARNITLQRCLISEALNEANHSKYAPGKRHGYAASIGGDVGSFHHNLLAHCAGRNWSLAGGLNKSGRHTGRLDIRNNVVYNWNHRTTDGGAKEVNFVANYYKPGAASRVFHVLKPERNRHFGPQDYFVEGNVMEGHYGADEPLAGVVEPRGEKLSEFVVETPFFEPYVTTQTAEQAYADVLADVGCNVPVLDEHDTRIIEEVRNGTTTYRGSKTGLPGIPDSQQDVGGWEDYPEVHRPADWDTDHDGLPGVWEKKRGLDPDDPSDGSADPDGDGYTNLEDYLNRLAAGRRL